MSHQSLLRCSLGLVLSLSLFAQTPRPPAPGPGGPGTGGTPTPSVPGRPGTTSPFPSPTTTTPYPEMPRPLFLAGKVMMDDGTPPPESVVIQLACNALPRNVGFTDRKGGFSVDLNNRLNNALFADASQTQDDSIFGSMSTSSMGNSRNPPGSSGGMRSGGTITERDLMGCDLQASLAGFRSDAVHLGTHRSLDNPDVGVIYLHRLANVEGLTISATSAMAPKDAQKALEKGRNEARKGKF